MSTAFVSRRVRSRAGAFMVLAALVVPASAGLAQTTSIDSGTVAPDSVQRLIPVRVTVTRDAARSPLDLPYAITTTVPDSLRPGQRHLSLDESLFLMPGVTVANRNNPAQDPRISIRGFGSRSSFGVRGVRILRDGIPLTLPDGQTAVDYMDLESVGAIEVLRGAASSLYGNAAGGVVDVRSTEPPRDALAIRARGLSGTYGLQRWLAALGGTSGPLGWQGNVTHWEQDGYRNYGRQRATTGFARGAWQAGGTELALTALMYQLPLAQDPGALTRAQFDTAPRMADPLWITRQVRKVASQNQVGLSARRPFAGGGEASASVYGARRSLFNARPAFIIDLDRTVYGASVRGTSPIQFAGVTNRLSGGVDFQLQDDDRANHTNCTGMAATGNCDPAVASGEKGAAILDQTEQVSSIGPYLRNEMVIGERLRFVVGGRADYVRFDVKDHYVTATDSNDTGGRTLSRVSPMAGLVARLTPFHALYGNVSTAFETPTASELTTKPDGSGGINPDLKPQHSTTYETGLKGVLLSWLRYDVAGFSTSVRDELIQFDVTSVPGRQYYRNAGRTSRRGAEVALLGLVGPLEVGASYSYSHFEFDEYVVGATSFAGKRIPGIPMNQAQAALTWHHRSLFATAEGLVTSSAFVNDANSARAPGYELLNLRAGGTAVLGRPWLSPVIGVQNVFDRKYVGSIGVNAAGGKYYEPGAGRAWYFGLTAAVGR